MAEFKPKSLQQLADNVRKRLKDVLKKNYNAIKYSVLFGTLIKITFWWSDRKPVPCNQSEQQLLRQTVYRPYVFLNSPTRC